MKPSAIGGIGALIFGRVRVVTLCGRMAALVSRCVSCLQDREELSEAEGLQIISKGSEHKISLFVDIMACGLNIDEGWLGRLECSSYQADFCLTMTGGPETPSYTRPKIFHDHQVLQQ